jgi:hypothetical protein
MRLASDDYEDRSLLVAAPDGANRAQPNRPRSALTLPTTPKLDDYAARHPRAHR